MTQENIKNITEKEAKNLIIEKVKQIIERNEDVIVKFIELKYKDSYYVNDISERNYIESDNYEARLRINNELELNFSYSDVTEYICPWLSSDPVVEAENSDIKDSYKDIYTYIITKDNEKYYITNADYFTASDIFDEITLKFRKLEEFLEISFEEAINKLNEILNLNLQEVIISKDLIEYKKIIYETSTELHKKIEYIYCIKYYDKNENKEKTIRFKAAEHEIKIYDSRFENVRREEHTFILYSNFSRENFEIKI
ncbi:MAG: hypothetical protein QW648_03940 [Nanoarchaeales archaeon]